MKQVYGLMLVMALAGCGLKGPLYDPNQQRAADESSVEANNTESEKNKNRRPRAAPQSQKEDRDRADAPAQDTDQPAAPLDPDRPNTTPPSAP